MVSSFTPVSFTRGDILIPMSSTGEMTSIPNRYNHLFTIPAGHEFATGGIRQIQNGASFIVFRDDDIIWNTSINTNEFDWMFVGVLEAYDNNPSTMFSLLTERQQLRNNISAISGLQTNIRAILPMFLQLTEIPIADIINEGSLPSDFVFTSITNPD